MSFSLSIDKLNDLVNQSKKQSSNNNDSKRTNIAWIPEGIHKIRLVVDPDQNLFREVRNHRVEDAGRIICNNSLRKLGVKQQDGSDIPECEICKMAYEVDSWQHKPKNDIMIYGFLYATDSPSDYFKPGKPYAFIVNNRFKKAVNGLLESLVSDSADFIASAFNPTISGGFFTIKLTRGTEGLVTITPVLQKKSDPLPNLAEWWIPLKDVWLSDSSYNSEKYEEGKKKMTVIYDKRKGYLNSKEGKEEQNNKLSEDLDNKVVDSPKTQAKPQQFELFKDTTKNLIKEEPVASTLAAAKPAKVVYLAAVVDEDNERTPCFGQYKDSESACIVCAANISCMELKFAS